MESFQLDQGKEEQAKWNCKQVWLELSCLTLRAVLFSLRICCLYLYIENIRKTLEGANAFLPLKKLNPVIADPEIPHCSEECATSIQQNDGAIAFTLVETRHISF